MRFHVFACTAFTVTFPRWTTLTELWHQAQRTLPLDLFVQHEELMFRRPIANSYFRIQNRQKTSIVVAADATMQVPTSYVSGSEGREDETSQLATPIPTTTHIRCFEQENAKPSPHTSLQTSRSTHNYKVLTTSHDDPFPLPFGLLFLSLHWTEFKPFKGNTMNDL